MHAAESPLSPLEGTIAAVVGLLHDQGIRGMVIGGVAASLLGRARATRDVDAVVWVPDPKEWPAFLAGARERGFAPRIDDPLGFALQARVLLLHHVPTAIDVDISFGGLPYEEEAIGRAVEGKIGRLRIPLPTPEDLVIMKAIAHRPRDAADIEGVLAAHADLDRARVLRWVAEFAEVLEMPEMMADLEAIMGRAPKAAKGKKKAAAAKGGKGKGKGPRS